MSKNLFLSFVFLFFGLNIYAQNTAEVYGRVRTDKAFAVELMNVAVKGFPGGTTTNKKGFYSLKILADTTVTLVFSHIEYKTITKTIRLKKGERYKLNVMPEKDITILQTVNIRNE